MSSFQNHIIEEIKGILKAVHHNPADIFQAEVLQIKGKINSAINSHIHQLRLREQWLLQQADTLTDCYLHEIQADAEKLAAVKGKLQCCLDLVEDKDIRETKSFATYTASIVKESKLAMLRDDYRLPTFSFFTDEGELMRDILRFGKLCNLSSHDAQSDASWSFADSVETASPVEPADCENCGGMSLDVEDLSKNLCLLEKVMQRPVMSVNDVCKADDVCNNLNDCRYDPACCDYVTGSNAYVAATNRAFQAITSVETPPRMESKASLFVSDDLKPVLDQTVPQVVSLHDEIGRILAGVVESGSITDQIGAPVSEPWPGSQAKIAQRISDDSWNTNAYIQNVTSEIMALTSTKPSGEDEFTPLSGTSPFLQNDSFLKPVHKSCTPGRSLEATVELSNILSQCSFDSSTSKPMNNQSKMHFEDLESNSFALKGKGWTTVQDVHEVLTEILNS